MFFLRTNISNLTCDTTSDLWTNASSIHVRWRFFYSGQVVWRTWWILLKMNLGSSTWKWLIVAEVRKTFFKKKQVFAKSSGQKTQQQQQQQQQIPCVGKKSNQEIMQLSLGILLDLIVPKQNGGHLFYPPNLDLYHGIHHHFSPPLIWQMFVTFSKHRRFANRSPRLQPKNSRKGPPNWPFFSWRFFLQKLFVCTWLTSLPSWKQSHIPSQNTFESMTFPTSLSVGCVSSFAGGYVLICFGGPPDRSMYFFGLTSCFDRWVMVSPVHLLDPWGLSWNLMVQMEVDACPLFLEWFPFLEAFSPSSVVKDLGFLR